MATEPQRAERVTSHGSWLADTAENANELAHTEARSHKVKTDPRMAECEMCRPDTAPCNEMADSERRDLG